MRRSNARAQNRSSSENNQHRMESIKLQFRPNLPHRSNLFSRNPKSTTAFTRSNVVILALFAIAVALFCYLFVISTGDRGSAKRKYGIVIDGGSTGSRIHVFQYVVRDRVPEFDFGKDGLVSIRVNPGLSSYSENPDAAGGSLAELLEFARKRVPEEFRGETVIKLMATAGMRMLELGVQEKILGSCMRVLRSSGFKFRDDWASVITGADEGIYAWIVANYALSTLGEDPQQTTGIIELGGASAQVTFVSREPVPPEFSYKVKFGNITYNLYSNSLLHYGQNVAFDLLRESHGTRAGELAAESLQRIDPCIPKGYSADMKSWDLSPDTLAEKKGYPSNFHPRGNFSECRSAALMLLQKGKEKCSYQRCDIGSTFIPKLQGNFLATENFFYTSKFFGLSPTAFISDMMRAGQQFCEEDWSKLKMKHHSLNDEVLSQYCFSSAYIVAILHDSLGIALDDERIGFVNHVGDIPLDWALGAFILQSTGDLDAEHPKWIPDIIRNDSSSLLVPFAIILILTFTAWSVLKWRKPQLKTIYDLEKGKYIVTRISRF